jgi:adenylate cyclase
MQFLWRSYFLQNQRQNQPLKAPLTTLLVVPMVVQVVGIISVVGYLSYHNGQKAIQDLSGQLRTSVTARVEEQVHDYLEKPMLVNAINVRLASQKLLPVNSPQEMESYFATQSKLFSDLGTIAYSDIKKRDYIGANGSEEYTILADPELGMRRYSFGEVDGQRGSLLSSKIDYDVRNRPWYKTALSSRQPKWSEVHPSPVGQRLDITAVQSFYNQTDSGEAFQGVFVSQVSLEGISQFLKRLEISRSGQVFILERNGLLIANSTTEDPFIPGVENQPPSRLPALQSRNPIIQNTVRSLVDRFQSLENIEMTEKLDFTLNGEQQFAQVQRFRDGNGIDWLIVVVVPESAFMGQIHENTRQTILLCLLAMGFAIVGGMKLSGRITRPLSQIAHASEALAEGQLTQSVRSSVILELSSLSDSFNSMASQLRDSFATLEHRVESRTVELKQEKDRSENLLLNILPATIVERLKHNDSVPAEQFDQATILFADIVGFTSLSAKLDPMELVTGLNQIFSAFDQLADKYGLEKIKTIGDAYMVVGGLPLRQVNHAQAIASMALEMQTEMLRLNQVMGEPLEIRIGIHTGPVVAGVIGIRKFIYDLWGDTVNVASRMESHGQPGFIQVTEATYDLLKNDYVLQSRGTIEVKGRGLMHTYWLLDNRHQSEILDPLHPLDGQIYR